MKEKNSLKSELFKCLNPWLLAEGFTFVISKDRFQRKRDDVTDVFQLVCLDGKPGYRIQPNVGVRIEQVENFFHQTSGFEPKVQKDTVTMGNSVGMFLGGDSRSCEFLLRQDSEITPIAQEIVTVFREFGFPYYECWKSLAAIDAELNNKPGKSTLHRPLPWFRCSTGIIVAKLTGRLDYDQLAAFYVEMMTSDNKGFYLQRFQALLKSLESI